MKKPATLGLAAVTALLLLGAGPSQPAGAAQKRAKPAPLSLQGYRTGMTMEEARALLRAGKVTRYETGYTDLFVYAPAPDSEIRIEFSCAARGYVVGRVELITIFDSRDSAEAVQAYERRLAARYGPPTATASDPLRIHSCWGQCGPETGGMRLTAETSGAGEGKQRLTLLLENDKIAAACAGLRSKKINSWLHGWISFAVAFKPGMTLNAAAKAYSARFKERFFVDEVPFSGEGVAAATGYELSDHEFFDALDAGARFFEGEGPGGMVMRFTGPQTEKAALDRRLYFSRFSTTNFKGADYRDFDRKLQHFIRAFGEPAGVVRQEGSLFARWEQGPVTRTLEIHSSGLITLEQSNLSLRDAYLGQAVEKIEQYRKSKFEKLPF